MHAQSQRTWTLTFFALAVVWAAVGFLMWSTSEQVSNPDKVLALMQDAPWRDNPNLNDRLRLAYLDRVIASQNRLDFQQRREFRDEGEEAQLAFFDTLTETEQHHYADGTVKPHLNKVVNILDKMSADTRKSITARLRRETGGAPRSDREREGRGAGSAATSPPSQPQEGEFDDFIGLGLVMQYDEASARRKLEMGRMLENMQAFLQGFRR